MKTSAIHFAAETVSKMTAAELVEFVGFLDEYASCRLRRELTSGPYAARIDATERRLAEKAAAADPDPWEEAAHIAEADEACFAKERA